MIMPEISITRGDVIVIVPERGPRRRMLVAHVEHHIITLADLDVSKAQASAVEVRRDGAVEVRRDGVLQPGGRFETGDLTVDSNAAFEYILRHQGMSVDWAIRYEGWSIVTIAPDGTETSDR
jgi:hypothetical protein